jgi:phosphate uptake regulator
MVEIRRIQKTGGGSYVVTLPKQWIDSLGIKEKDRISIITQPDSTLVLSPEGINKSSDKREKVFNIDEIGHEGIGRKTVLYRMLIGAYIMGFNNYRIISSSKLYPSVIQTVINFRETALGIIIDEQTKNSIILKDILNPTEMPFENSIRRMHVIIKTMHEDLMEAWDKKDEHLINNIIERDKQINQRNWLVARETNMILRDVLLAQKMNVTLEDAHHYFLISKQLERIGDHARLIAKQVLNFLEDDLTSEIKEKIKIASRDSMKILSDCLIAWESKTRKKTPNKAIKLANESIENNRVLKDTCESITKVRSNDPSIYIPVNYIAESLRRTGDYAVNIAEIVIDNLIIEDF